MKAIRLKAEPKEPMRSARASETWTNPEVFLDEVPEPKVGPRDLLLKVAYVGLCGSDFHLAEPGKNGAISYPGLLELPVTLGHEFSAVIAGYGSEISAIEKKNFPLGTAVTAEEMLWCGHCAACRGGHPNHCENLEEIGFTRNGAHSEYIAVGIKYCWSLQALEKSLGLETALKVGALTEPYAVSFRALFQGAQGNHWMPGNNLVVFGAGPIGIAALDLANAAGARKTVIVEPIAERRKMAEVFHAGAVFSGQESDLAKKISTALSGNANWIVDAAGAPKEVFSVAEKILGVGGSICLLARTDERISLDPEFLITKNARVFGSQGHSGEQTFGRVLSLMAEKKIRPLALVDRVLSLEEAVDCLNKHARAAGKILVKPNKEITV